jgi:16S rRNA processing protein RimM
MPQARICVGAIAGAHGVKGLVKIKSFTEEPDGVAAYGPPRICVGAIAGAHGVKGLVKIKSFTEEPDGVAAYGPLSDEAGEREFTLALTGRAKGLIIARIDGVEDRNAAEALRGTRLYVERAALPPTAEEAYYHTDLIGYRSHRPRGGGYGRRAGRRGEGAL